MLYPQQNAARLTISLDGIWDFLLPPVSTLPPPCRGQSGRRCPPASTTRTPTGPGGITTAGGNQTPSERQTGLSEGLRQARGQPPPWPGAEPGGQRHRPASDALVRGQCPADQPLSLRRGVLRPVRPGGHPGDRRDPGGGDQRGRPGPLQDLSPGRPSPAGAGRHDCPGQEPSLRRRWNAIPTFDDQK